MQCVGIDIAKGTFTACLCMYEFNQGCSTAPVVFNNDKTGFNQFVKWSRKEALKGYPLRYVMEPTGVYYEQLASHLNKLSLNVCVVLPNKAREFAKYEDILTKTDNMDAYAPAHQHGELHSALLADLYQTANIQRLHQCHHRHGR